MTLADVENAAKAAVEAAGNAIRAITEVSLQTPQTYANQALAYANEARTYAEEINEEPARTEAADAAAEATDAAQAAANAVAQSEAQAAAQAAADAAAQAAAQVASCFNQGTKILCLNSNSEEEYVAIENLKRGDLVKTLKHGYKKLELIANNVLIKDPNTQHYCMYILKATETNGLIEDLILTGGHGLMVDKLSVEEQQIQKKMGFEQMVNDKHLLLACFSKDFEKVENTNIHTYYHFILENDGDDDNDRYGVYANGVLAETPAKTPFVECCNIGYLRLL